LKEIRVNGIDVTDHPLPFGRSNQSLSDVEVTLTDRINMLNGTVGDDRALPAPGSHVLVFSTDRTRWYQSSRFLRHRRADADGRFSVVGLPLGTYYAAALARLPADGDDAWQDPEFLTTIAPRASTITLVEGETRALNLRLPAIARLAAHRLPAHARLRSRRRKRGREQLAHLVQPPVRVDALSRCALADSFSGSPPRGSRAILRQLPES
jgi:hypothetical protein